MIARLSVSVRLFAYRLRPDRVVVRDPLAGCTGGRLRGGVGRCTVATRLGGAGSLGRENTGRETARLEYPVPPSEICRPPMLNESVAVLTGAGQRTYTQPGYRYERV